MAKIQMNIRIEQELMNEVDQYAKQQTETTGFPIDRTAVVTKAIKDLLKKKIIVV